MTITQFALIWALLTMLASAFTIIASTMARRRRQRELDRLTMEDELRAFEGRD